MSLSVETAQSETLDFDVIFSESLKYKPYRDHVDELIIKGKTTGVNQEERLIEFTKLNVHRMNRIDKSVQVEESAVAVFSNLKNTYKMLLIGDAWCGDCAQILPVLEKIAESSGGKIEMSIISRDTFPNLIEAFQTNGANAVPKVLIFDETKSRVLSTWGPRPKPAQDIMLNWKANKDTISWEQFENDLHLWYARNRGVVIIEEMLGLFSGLG